MNILYTGYDIQNSKRIDYVPSKIFKNLVNDINVLQCDKLIIEREIFFSDFKIGRNIHFNRDSPDMFTTTDMISKIHNKKTNLLKEIDEKGSQHLSRMLGVESKIDIHTYNPEILIQKLEGVSEEGYRLKTRQENVDKIDEDEEEEEEEEVYNILKPIQEFMDETEERYYEYESEDERNLNLLTKPSKRIQTSDIENEKSVKKQANINDFIDPHNDLSIESITRFKNLKKEYSTEYDLALEILLENQDNARLEVNNIVFEKYNEILKKNGKTEIDKQIDHLPEFILTFVKKMVEKTNDMNETILPRDKRADESVKQHEIRIKKLDKAKDNRKKMKDQNVELTSMMKRHLNERLVKVKENEKTNNKSNDKRII